jgi:hypothetical protein
VDAFETSKKKAIVVVGSTPPRYQEYVPLHNEINEANQVQTYPTPISVSAT